MRGDDALAGDNNSAARGARHRRRAIKLYNGKYPDAKREQARRSVPSGAYFDLVQHSRPDAGQFVVQMTPAAGTDANWGQLFHLARHSQNITNFITMGTAYARLFPERADEVREMIYPLGTSQATLTPYYGIMTPDSAAHHVASNCERGHVSVGSMN